MDAETLTGAEEIKLEEPVWRLSDEVCEELRLEAFDGLKSIPRRGAEIGGILTQSRDNAATGEIQTVESAADATVVNGSELIPSEHLFGPSYRLSPADIEVVEARCHNLREDPHLKLIGLFRSSVRDILEITPDDLELLERTAPDAQLFAIIKPSPLGDGLIYLFERDESQQWYRAGEIKVCNKIAPPPRVPMPSISAAAPYSSRSAEPAQAERPWYNDLDRFPPKRQGMSRGRSLVAGICIVAALLVAFGVFQFVRRSPGPTAQISLSGNPDLGLQLLQQQDSLRLTWSKNLPSVLSSTGGTLLIRDGGQQRVVSLDSGQVALGVIYYSPISDDVSFNLNIKDTSSRTTSGMARILIGSRPRASTPAAPPIAGTARAAAPASTVRKAAPPRATTPGEEAPVKATPAKDEPRATQSPPAPIQPQVSSPPPVQQPAQEVKNPVQEGNPVPAATIETARAPGTLDVANRPINQTPSLSNSTPANTPPPVTAQSLTRNIQPGDSDTPIPARPLVKVMPSSREAGGPAHTMPILVTVQVSIDDKGRVTAAQAMPGASPYWSGRSVEAARQWRYEPAMLHGQHVPSIAAIVFKFAAR